MLSKGFHLMDQGSMLPCGSYLGIVSTCVCVCCVLCVLDWVKTPFAVVTVTHGALPEFTAWRHRD